MFIIIPTCFHCKHHEIAVFHHFPMVSSSFSYGSYGFSFAPARMWAFIAQGRVALKAEQSPPAAVARILLQSIGVAYNASCQTPHELTKFSCLFDVHLCISSSGNSWDDKFTVHWAAPRFLMSLEDSVPPTRRIRLQLCLFLQWFCANIDMPGSGWWLFQFTIKHQSMFWGCQHRWSIHGFFGGAAFPAFPSPELCANLYNVRPPSYKLVYDPQ